MVLAGAQTSYGASGQKTSFPLSPWELTLEFAPPAALFKQIMKGAQEAIIAADATGVVRFWNSAAEAMFGYMAREALGQTLNLIVLEGYRHCH